MALLDFHYARAVALPFVFFAGVVIVVDVKTNKMAKHRELGAENLASNHKIKSIIKYKNK